MILLFKDHEGRRWTVEIRGVRAGGSGRGDETVPASLGSTLLVFEALDGKERRTLTVGDYVTDRDGVGEDQFRTWLEQAKKAGSG
jgi:hypothetical protein